MVDKWSRLRLYSVQGNLYDHIESVKDNLLRYGFLIKSNLPREYGENIIEVDYSLRKMIEPCVILYVDKTSPNNIKSSNEYCEAIEEIIGDTKVSIYEDSETMLILDVRV